MRLSLLICFFFATSGVFGQKLSEQSEALVKKMIEVNQLHHRAVGAAGVMSEQYLSFLELKEKSSQAELVRLLKHNNTVVKGYASWALADNKYERIADVLSDFLSSGETARTMSGCIIFDGTLSAELYYRVLYQGFENPLPVEDTFFFNNLVRRFDSLIIYEFPKSELLEVALSHNRANPNHYLRIKQLALQQKNHQAIIELVKYRDADDVDELISLGKKAFPAISFYPHPRVWSFLKTFLYTEKSPEFFEAVASFRNESALEALSQYFDIFYRSADLESIRELDAAVMKHYDEAYSDLLLNIWNKSKMINYETARRLFADNQEKAAESFLKGLLEPASFKNIATDYGDNAGDSVLPFMLGVVAKYHSNQLVNACASAIHAHEFTKLESILAFVREYRVGGLEDVLLNKISSSTTAYDIYHLSETLLLYNSPLLNKRLSQVLRSNRKSWDWGNWSESFQKLFEKHSIKI